MQRNSLHGGKQDLVFLIGLASYLGGIAVWGIDRPAWGDESHFYETVKLFGTQFNLSTLKHYEEMSTPFPFMAYALWGRIFSFELPVLRVFSLVVAGATYFSFYRLAANWSGKSYVPILLTLVLAFNPYMIGLSLFVFPDMLTMLFVVLTLKAVFDNNLLLLGVSNGLGLLSKQYFAFITLAVAILYIVRFFHRKTASSIQPLIVLVASLVPCLVLFWFWGGISPVNEIKSLYLYDRLSYHPSFASLYVVLLFLYPLPVILHRWRTFYTSWQVLGIAFLLSGVYWMIPVQAAAPAVAAGVETVGLGHRLLSQMMPDLLVDAFFFACFFLSLPLIYAILQDIFIAWRRGFTEASTVLHLTVVSFFIVMPFSYLCWEKYFLPVLPALLIVLTITSSDSRV